MPEFPMERNIPENGKYIYLGQQKTPAFTGVF
jgi:hypothetical protein